MTSWYFLYQMKVQTLIEKFIGLVSPQMPYIGRTHGQPKLWLLSFSCLLFFIPFLIKLFLKQGYMAYKSWHNEIGLFPHILTLLVINLMIFYEVAFLKKNKNSMFQIHIGWILRVGQIFDDNPKWYRSTSSMLSKPQSRTLESLQ